MIEMSCSTCGEKARVQSFLTAAHQPSTRCGQLLIGGGGASSTRPAWSASPGQASAPAWEPANSSGGMWNGVIAGVFIAIAAVATIAFLGRAIPVQVQGAFLGALAAVLLGPFIAISSFLSMLILPFSLEGVLGDGIWSRLARANNERSLAPLVFPFLILVGLPMALGGIGGARVTAIEAPLVVGAGIGAIILGAIFGAVAGSLLGGSRQHA